MQPMPPLNAVIDISHYNRDPDFTAARQGGIVGVIHKATQGADGVDPTYAANHAQAQAAGLMWGAYHFATGDDPQAQAQHFLAVTGADPGTLLALDLEHNPTGSSMSLDQARTFVTAVQQATGRYPGLYGGSYLKELLGGNADPILAQCWFWLAEYGPVPHLPEGWPTWTLWQYTDGAFGPEPHEVAGVGRCDRDLRHRPAAAAVGRAGPVNHAVAAPAGRRFCSITSHTMRAARSLGASSPASMRPSMRANAASCRRRSRVSRISGSSAAASFSGVQSSCTNSGTTFSPSTRFASTKDGTLTRRPICSSIHETL